MVRVNMPSSSYCTWRWPLLCVYVFLTNDAGRSCLSLLVRILRMPFFVRFVEMAVYLANNVPCCMSAPFHSKIRVTRMVSKGLILFPLEGHSGYGSWEVESSNSHVYASRLFPASTVTRFRLLSWIDGSSFELSLSLSPLLASAKHDKFIHHAKFNWVRIAIVICPPIVIACAQPQPWWTTHSFPLTSINRIRIMDLRLSGITLWVRCMWLSVVL